MTNNMYACKIIILVIRDRKQCNTLVCNLVYFEKYFGSWCSTLEFGIQSIFQGSAPNTSAELSTPGSAHKLTLTPHSRPCSTPRVQHSNLTLGAQHQKYDLTYCSIKFKWKGPKMIKLHDKFRTQKATRTTTA